MKPTINFLVQLLHQHPNHPIVIAYSGGVDSQVLLMLMVELRHLWHRQHDLTVCHIHHGLSDNADSWLSFAEHTCHKHDLKFMARKVKLDLGSGQSVEAQARELRYEVLSQIYNEPSIILTGHHLNDQAETLLLALKRGSGVKGLSAMALKTKRNKDLLCRPMLNVTRKTVKSYAVTHQLEWVEDESNNDNRYDRNFIRNDIIPLIETRWPSFSQMMARTAELCRENQILAEELAAQDLAIALSNVGTLRVETLHKLSQSRCYNVVRFYLAKLNERMPSQAQLNEFYLQLSSQDDKVPEIKLGDVVVRRFQQQLYFTPVFSDVSEKTLTIDLFKIAEHNVAVELPDKLGVVEFSANRFDQCTKPLYFSLAEYHGLTIKFCHENPTILPDYRQHSRPLKKVLQELKLPPWQRKRLPFIFQDKQLVAIPDHFVCQPFITNKHQFNVFVRWLRK